MVRIIKTSDMALNAMEFDDNYGWAATIQALDEAEMLERQACKERDKSTRRAERIKMGSEENCLAAYEDFSAKFSGHSRSQRLGRRK